MTSKLDVSKPKTTKMNVYKTTNERTTKWMPVSNAVLWYLLFPPNLSWSWKKKKKKTGLANEHMLMSSTSFSLLLIICRYRFRSRASFSFISSLLLECSANDKNNISLLFLLSIWRQSISLSLFLCSSDIPLFSLDLSMCRFVYLFFLSLSVWSNANLDNLPVRGFFFNRWEYHSFSDLSQLHRYLLIRPSADVNLSSVFVFLLLRKNSTKSLSNKYSEEKKALKSEETCRSINAQCNAKWEWFFSFNPLE